MLSALLPVARSSEIIALVYGTIIIMASTTATYLYRVLDFSKTLLYASHSFLSHKQAIHFVRDTGHSSTRLFEGCPRLIVRLRLVKVHSRCIFIHFVKDEFIGVLLRSKNV
jgi:hypothetical protein